MGCEFSSGTIQNLKKQLAQSGQQPNPRQIKDLRSKEARLDGVNAEGAIMLGANMPDLNMRHINLRDADLRGLNLSDTFPEYPAERLDIDLTGARFDNKTNLEGSSWSGLNGHGTQIYYPSYPVGHELRNKDGKVVSTVNREGRLIRRRGRVNMIQVLQNLGQNITATWTHNFSLQKSQEVKNPFQSVAGKGESPQLPEAKKFLPPK